MIEGSGVFNPSWMPGLHPKYLDAVIAQGVKAVIIEGYHSGTIHACDEREKPNCEYSAVPFVRRTVALGIPVFLTFGSFVGDPDNKVGFKPFDEGDPGGYETSRRIIAAGAVPLKATQEQGEAVYEKICEVVSRTDDPSQIIQDAYDAFPFDVPLQQIVNSAKDTE